MSTDQIVICDMESPDGEWKLHFFNPDRTSIAHVSQSICEHDKELVRPYKLLPIIIGSTEYIAVSCRKCKMISLINPEDVEPIMAYTGTRGEAGPMSLGLPGKLCMVGRVSGKVSLLDCTTTKFSLNRRLCEIDDLWSDSICYIECYDLIVLTSWYKKRICAMRSSDGQIVWDKSTQVVKDEEWKPYGLSILHDSDLLLVGDRYKARIMILSPGTGDILQTVPLPQETVCINELHLINDKLLVHYHGKLSNYSVSHLHLYKIDHSLFLIFMYYSVI